MPVVLKQQTISTRAMDHVLLEVRVNANVQSIHLFFRTANR
jgi:hypothetical protein